MSEFDVTYSKIYIMDKNNEDDRMKCFLASRTPPRPCLDVAHQPQNLGDFDQYLTEL